MKMFVGEHNSSDITHHEINRNLLTFLTNQRNFIAFFLAIILFLHCCKRGLSQVTDQHIVPQYHHLPHYIISLLQAPPAPPTVYSTTPPDPPLLPTGRPLPPASPPPARMAW